MKVRCVNECSTSKMCPGCSECMLCCKCGSVIGCHIGSIDVKIEGHYVTDDGMVCMACHGPKIINTQLSR